MFNKLITLVIVKKWFTGTLRLSCEEEGRCHGISDHGNYNIYTNAESNFAFPLHTTHKVQPSVSLMFLPHFNIFSDLLTDPWKYRVYLFYILNKKKKLLVMMWSSCLFSNKFFSKYQSNCVCNSDTWPDSSFEINLLSLTILLIKISYYYLVNVLSIEKIQNSFPVMSWSLNFLGTNLITKRQ